MKYIKKISIVVPVYNVEEYLYNCLNSVASQTYKNIECVIVNDCSTDGCLGIIYEFMAKYPNIFILLNNELNIGVGKSRVAGVMKCSGEYITLLDGDDSLTVDFVEKTLNYIITKDLDIVQTEHYNNYDGVMKVSNRVSRFRLNQYYDALLWGRLYRASFLKSNIVGIRVFAEDFPCHIHLMLNNPQFGFLNEPLYIYTIRNNSLSNTCKNFVELAATLDCIYGEFIDAVSGELDSMMKSTIFNFALDHYKMLDNLWDRLKLYRYAINLIGNNIDYKLFSQYYVNQKPSALRKLKMTIYSRGLYILRPDVKKMLHHCFH